VSSQQTSYPLKGVWAKYEQAARHLQHYKDCYKDFATSNDFAVLVSNQTVEPKGALRPEDVWPELSCVVGDCIHNLRSALDHVAFAFGSQRLTEKQLRRLYFTICLTQAAFDKATGEEPISIMGEDWQAFLQSVQPFNGQPYDALGTLHELDNIDKHRLIFSLSARSDVNSRRSDGTWDKKSLDLRDGLVQMPTADGAVVIAAHYLSLPHVTADSARPRPVETDLLNFYTIVGGVIRMANARFFQAES